MKKLSFAVAMMLGMGLTGAQAAETGTLNFSGNVTTRTCSIDSASLNTTLSFGNLAKNSILSLAAIGDTNAQLTKLFNIKLVDCPNGTPISVKFDGDPTYFDGNVQGYRDNKSENQVNIAAMVFDADSGAKVLPKQFVSKGVAIEGVNDLKYNISLTRYATSAVVTNAGDFSMAINYTMSYE